MELKYKLRPWVLQDIESLVRYANNINVAKNMTDAFPYPYTEEAGSEYLQLVVSQDPVTIFAVDVNGEAVGSIGVFPQADIYRKSAEVGYWLAEPYWGKGVISSAVKEIVKYGFETFDVTRIYARPFSSNLGSQRVLEKAGFVKEACLKNAIYKKGEYLDEIIYSYLK